jgi:hypothetical protein
MKSEHTPSQSTRSKDDQSFLVARDAAREAGQKPLSLPAPRVVGSQNIGPNKITMRRAAKLRAERLVWEKGDGYWAKDTAEKLKSYPGYYRVVTAPLTGTPPAGTIHRRKATSGKYGRGAASVRGPSLTPAITVSQRNATYVDLEGHDVTRMAPAGMEFRVDPNGVYLFRFRDGMDYHPDMADWLDDHFASRVIKAMAANKAARRAADVMRRKSERRQAKLEREAPKRAKMAAKALAEAEARKAIYERSVADTRVTLEDSRRAGNCIEGSLAFAERKLGMTREEILSGRWLVSVPAKRLLAVANGDRPRVEAAIRVAYARETMISI